MKTLFALSLLVLFACGTDEKEPVRSGNPAPIVPTWNDEDCEVYCNSNQEIINDRVVRCFWPCVYLQDISRYSDVEVEFFLDNDNCWRISWWAEDIRTEAECGK